MYGQFRKMLKNQKMTELSLGNIEIGEAKRHNLSIQNDKM